MQDDQEDEDKNMPDKEGVREDDADDKDPGRKPGLQEKYELRSHMDIVRGV